MVNKIIEQLGNYDKDVADAVAQTHENQAETQADTESGDWRARQNGATAGQKHQEHCADAFSDVLFDRTHNTFCETFNKSLCQLC